MTSRGASETVAPGEESAIPRRGAIRGTPRWFLAVLALAVLPLFVAAGVQAHRGWRPVSDQAAVAVLANDVLSTRTPLVGMPSTLSNEVAKDESVHHPGPLLFWALAIPDRLAGSAPIGILLGMALLNASAIIVAGLVLARLAGPRVATGVLALVAVLTWSLGRQVIVDPWNPYAALFPLFALCVLAWASGAGMPRALLGVALFASFVSQTHLLYAPLGIVMLSAGVAGAVIGFVTSARRGDAWRREAKVAAVGTAGMLLVCWALPVWDQLRNPPGNLMNVLQNLSGNPDERPIGLDWAVRFGVRGIGVPPVFSRIDPEQFDILSVGWGSLGPIAIVSALVLVLGLVAMLVVGVRRRDRVVVAGMSTALLALASTVFVLARVPSSLYDVPPPYRALQMWPVACFAWSAAAVGVVRLVRWPPVARRVGFLLAAVVLVVSPVVIAFTNSASSEDTVTQDAVGRLVAQMEPTLLRGEPYRVELAAPSGNPFVGGAAQAGLFRELARRGYDARVRADDAYLGRSHAAPPDAVRLLVRTGRTVPPPAEPGAELIAEVDMLSADDRAASARFTAELRAALEDPALVTDKGRAALAAGATGPDAELMRRLRDSEGSPTVAYDLNDALVRGLVRNQGPISDLVVRVGPLQVALNDSLYSVFLVLPE